jgi:hypothetical protein
LFQLRLKFKSQGNDPAQNLVKLMLNSCYGKTALRHSETTKKILRSEEAKDKFINRHYREINKIITIEKTNVISGKIQRIYVVDVQNNKLNHFNRVHCGITILSMSKRIMNEVMTLADDKIYYQDTDSMHIQQMDITKLAEDFQAKYSRKLIGKGMGQFHSDFASSKLTGNIYSSKFIALGKKCYIDELKSDENPGVVDYHIRMKGIPNNAIMSYCKK